MSNKYEASNLVLLTVRFVLNISMNENYTHLNKYVLLNTFDTYQIINQPEQHIRALIDTTFRICVQLRSSVSLPLQLTRVRTHPDPVNEHCAYARTCAS